MKKLLLTLALAAITAHGQELITNGDFETDAVAAGSYLYVTNGNGNTITGWTLEDLNPSETVNPWGDVDLVGEGVTMSWAGTTASQCVDLHGLTRGEISQTITTTAATEYTLSFTYSHNRDDSLSSRDTGSLMVRVMDESTNPDTTIAYLNLTPMGTRFFTRGSTKTNDVTITHSSGWTETNLTFTATQASHKIIFNGGGTYYTSAGSLIDDVSVTAVP